MVPYCFHHHHHHHMNHHMNHHHVVREAVLLNATEENLEVLEVPPEHLPVVRQPCCESKHHVLWCSHSRSVRVSKAFRNVLTL